MSNKAHNKEKAISRPKKRSTVSKQHGPGGPMGRPVEKAKDFKGTMKKLMGSLSKYRIGFVITFLFAIGSTIFTIIGPTIFGNATTLIVEGLMNKIGGGSGIDFKKLGKIILTLILLYSASTVFSLIQGFITTSISQGYLPI